MLLRKEDIARNFSICACFLCFSNFVFLNEINVNMKSRGSKIEIRGKSFMMKDKKEIPHFCHMKIFCGLPMGVNEEPTFAEIASKIINFETSLFNKFCIPSVKGTTTKRATSFVKKEEKKAVRRIKKKASFLSVFIWERIFSENICNKPLSFNPVEIRSKPAKIAIVFQ